MPSRLTAHAQPFLDRILAIDFAYPPWDEAEVIAAMAQQYFLLQEPMPKVQVVADLGDAYELADRGTWDDDRDQLFDRLVVDAIINLDRMLDALSVVYSNSTLTAIQHHATEMQKISGPNSQVAHTSVAHAALPAIVMNQAGFSALTAPARFLAIVSMKELDALEHGLGWYFPTKERTILVPLTPLPVHIAAS